MTITNRTFLLPTARVKACLRPETVADMDSRNMEYSLALACNADCSGILFMLE